MVERGAGRHDGIIKQLIPDVFECCVDGIHGPVEKDGCAIAQQSIIDTCSIRVKLGREYLLTTEDGVGGIS